MTHTNPNTPPTDAGRPPVAPERQSGGSRSQRWLDHAVGLVLLVGSLLALLATDGMGFVRDEAFYFRHAETYQDWLVDLEAGGDKREAALKRERILKVWRNNFEHPPLDKVLFGYSWRHFGRKLRPVSTVRAPRPQRRGQGGRKGRSEPAGRGERQARSEASQATARVTGLGPSHGFEKGARVVLLSPQLVGASPSPEGRAVAAGEVTARTRWSATVALDPGADAKALQAACKPAGPDVQARVIRRTGCEALEERAGYVLSESAAMRAPGALFAALLVWLVWLTARGFFGGNGRAPWLRRPFALVAAVGFLLIPRAFYHSHLACFDLTIVTLLYATTLAYHRSLRDRRWLLPTALLWGLSLLAKHNAFVLPGALMAHWAYDAYVEGRLSLSGPDGAPVRLDRRTALWLAGGALAAVVLGALVSKALALAVLLAALAQVARLHLPPLPAAWFWMLPVGLVVLVVGWPLLWVDTTHNLLRWIEFHLHHEHYMQQYFGAVLAYPPFPFAMPWVLTATTWPLTLLIPALAGFGGATWREARWLLARLRGRSLASPPARTALEPLAHTAAGRSLRRLLLMSAVWPIVLIAMPSTPVFGGTKHWFLAYPFLLLLAGLALQRAWLTLARAPRPLHVALAWGLALLIAAPAAQATRDVHPNGTLYYNELVGGVPGAAAAGLQRQFWGGATRDGLAFVNRRAARGARVWFHNSAWGAYRMYQREGWFRRDLAYHGTPKGSSLGFYHHQKDHDDYELDCMQDYGVAAPERQVQVEGVPVLSVYVRPSAAPALPSPPVAKPTPAARAPAAPARPSVEPAARVLPRVRGVHRRAGLGQPEPATPSHGR